VTAPEEQITVSDVQYAAKMLAVSKTIDILEVRCAMRPWLPAFWVRWFLLRTHAQLLRDKTVQHHASQGER